MRYRLCLFVLSLVMTLSAWPLAGAPARAQDASGEGYRPDTPHGHD